MASDSERFNREQKAARIREYGSEEAWRDAQPSPKPPAEEDRSNERNDDWHDSDGDDWDGYPYD